MMELSKEQKKRLEGLLNGKMVKDETAFFESVGFDDADSGLTCKLSFRAGWCAASMAIANIVQAFIAEEVAKKKNKKP